MVTLVLKELLVQKKVLVFAVLYPAIFAFAFQNLGEQQPLAIIVAVGYMCVMFSGAWDEKCGADKLWNSLPVRKIQIVGAKYLAVVAYGLVTTAITWVILSVLSLAGFSGIVANVTILNAVLGIAAVLLFASLYLPFYFAFGYMKSRMLNILVMLGALFALNLSTSLANQLSERWEWLGFLKKTGGFGAGAMALAAFAVLVALSFFASLKLYARREF